MNELPAPDLTNWNKCNPKEQSLILEYIRTVNMTQAYRDAYRQRNGSLPRKADAKGWKKFQEPKIIAALEEKKKELAWEAEVEAVQLLVQDRRIATADIRDIFEPDGTPIAPHELPEHVACAVKKVHKKENYTKQGDLEIHYIYEFWDKHKALDRLYRYLQMGPDYVQRNEHTGANGGPIQQQVNHNVPPEAKEVFQKITGKDFDQVYDADVQSGEAGS